MNKVIRVYVNVYPTDPMHLYICTSLFDRITFGFAKKACLALLVLILEEVDHRGVEQYRLMSDVCTIDQKLSPIIN
jgi:hypothetical protein